jgi:hypothetical protein
VVYNVGKLKLVNGAVAGGTVKMLLIETVAAGAFDPDVATITALLAIGGVAELTAAGYARQSVGTVTYTQDNANDRVNIDCPQVDFGALSTGGGGDVVVAVVFYLDGANDGARFPLSYHGISTQALNGGTFSIAVADFIRGTN